MQRNAGTSWFRRTFWSVVDFLLTTDPGLLEQLPQQVANGVAKGSVYALIAVGYTMVYGVLQLINFAHGEIYMLGAYAGYYPAKWAGQVPDTGAKPVLPLYVVGMVFLGAIAFCTTLGMLIERFAYKPLRNSRQARRIDYRHWRQSAPSEPGNHGLRC